MASDSIQKRQVCDEERNCSGELACPVCVTEGCCKAHQPFICASCGKLTSYIDGAADDRPMDCSTCWVNFRGSTKDAQWPRSLK